MRRPVDSTDDRIVGTWVAEQSRSRVEFRLGRRLVGRFERYAAIAKTGEDPSDTSLRVVVHAASFRTEGVDRSERLRSIIALRSNEFPSITYRATDVERTGDVVVAHGELTINGIARPLDAVVSLSRPVSDPDGRTRVALGLRGTVRRGDYRIGPDLDRRVRDVEVTVRLVLVLQGPAGRVAPGGGDATRVVPRGPSSEPEAAPSGTGRPAAPFVAKLPARSDRRERERVASTSSGSVSTPAELGTDTSDAVGVMRWRTEAEDPFSPTPEPRAGSSASNAPAGPGADAATTSEDEPGDGTASSTRRVVDGTRPAGATAGPSASASRAVATALARRNDLASERSVEADSATTEARSGPGATAAVSGAGDPVAGVAEPRETESHETGSRAGGSRDIEPGVTAPRGPRPGRSTDDAGRSGARVPSFLRRVLARFRR